MEWNRLWPDYEPWPCLMKSFGLTEYWYALFFFRMKGRKTKKRTKTTKRKSLKEARQRFRRRKKKCKRKKKWKKKKCGKWVLGQRRKLRLKGGWKGKKRKGRKGKKGKKVTKGARGKGSKGWWNPSLNTWFTYLQNYIAIEIRYPQNVHILLLLQFSSPHRTSIMWQTELGKNTLYSWYLYLYSQAAADHWPLHQVYS